MNCIHRFLVNGFIALYPLKVYGKENIPNGKAVMLCNHFRGIDPGFIAKVYNKDIKFLAKKELFKNKLLAKIITSFGAISIDREHPDIKTMLEIIKYLKEEHKILIFPEGTRNRTDTNELQEIKNGAEIFAVKTKAPILPMMIYKKSKIFRKTYMMIGKPFELTEFYDKKLTQEDYDKMNAIIVDKLKTVHKELTDLIEKKHASSKK